MPAVRAVPPDLVVLDLMLAGSSHGLIDLPGRCAPIRRPRPFRHHGDGEGRGSGAHYRPRARRPTTPSPSHSFQGGSSARVTALLRRATRPAAAADILRYGPITIDADRHAVAVAGEEVRLTAKEFLLLQYLLQHRGRVLSRDLLLTDVWGYQYTGGTRTVDVHIRRLREKMPVLADAIETVKQFGYKLVDHLARGGSFIMTFRTRSSSPPSGRQPSRDRRGRPGIVERPAQPWASASSRPRETKRGSRRGRCRIGTASRGARRRGG